MQMKREESEKHLENFRGEETKFMNQISSKINVAASEHQKLTEEVMILLEQLSLILAVAIAVVDENRSPGLMDSIPGVIAPMILRLCDHTSR